MLARPIAALQGTWTLLALACFATAWLVPLEPTRVAGATLLAVATGVLLTEARARWLAFAAAPLFVLLLGEAMLAAPVLYVAGAVAALTTLNELFEQYLQRPWSRVLARLGMFSLFSIASAIVVLATWAVSHGTTRPTFRAFFPWPLTMLLTLFAVAALDKLREER